MESFCIISYYPARAFLQMKTPDYVLLEQMIGSANQESDRGCALILAANLDNRLCELCKALCVNLTSEFEKKLFFGNGSLATFSSRIDISFALGLLSIDEHRDIHLIRKIRNDFAHNEVGVTFESPAIKSRCSELRMAQEMKTDYPDLAHHVKAARNTFQVVVFSLCLVILDRSKAALDSKRTTPASSSILPKP